MVLIITVIIIIKNLNHKNNPQTHNNDPQTHNNDPQTHDNDPQIHNKKIQAHNAGAKLKLVIDRIEKFATSKILSSN